MRFAKERAHFVVVGLIVCFAPLARPQILHPTETNTFDVATIKPLDTKHGGFGVWPLGSTNPVENAGSVWVLIAKAFNIPSAQQLIMPDALKSDQVYTVEAKIPDDVYKKMQSLNPEERQKIVQGMLQKLLVDRFKLKFHFGRANLPAYELVVDKHGSKLPAPLDSSVEPGSFIVSPSGVMAVRHMKLDAWLSSSFFNLGRPIVNKTGKTGMYNLNVTLYKSQPNNSDQIPITGSARRASDEDYASSIFTILREQFGLRLVPAKDELETLVIDSVSAPTEN